MTTRQGRRPQSRGKRPPSRAARPLPRGDRLFTPGAGQARGSVERASAKPLVYLHQLPSWVIPLALAAFFVVGLALPGVLGVLALAVVAGFLAWLAYVSWPALGGRTRALRVTAVGVIVVLAIVQARR